MGLFDSFRKAGAVGPMDEKRFWAMIDDAWKAAGVANADKRARRVLGASEDAEPPYEEAMLRMVDRLTVALMKLSGDDLLAFDRILERKLYDLDRADLHEYTDGSDDGFLYVRGFIVAIGESYYRAVLGDPSKAAMDSECEDMCYVSWHIYRERFGDVPESGISRETGSNKAGWPD